MAVKSRGHWFAAAYRRVAPTNARRATALCVVFAASLALALYLTRAPVAVPIATSVDKGVTDPVARFAQTRTGHLLLPSQSGGLCRRVLFENRTGALLDAGEVPCGPSDVPPEVLTNGADRLMAVRKAFQR